jgi:hypothetical protein
MKIIGNLILSYNYPRIPRRFSKTLKISSEDTWEMTSQKLKIARNQRKSLFTFPNFVVSI